MINSKQVLFGKIGNDENYTPAFVLESIASLIFSYVDKFKSRVGRSPVVWCPFDKEDSEFVKFFQKNKIDVVFSHIEDDKDFFEYEPEKWDIILSNPPFSNKRKYFERALAFEKPFMLLMTLACLNDKYPLWSFYEKKRTPQIVKFNNRIIFTNPTGTISDKITFQSGFIGSDFLSGSDFVLLEVPSKTEQKKILIMG